MSQQAFNKSVNNSLSFLDSPIASNLLKLILLLYAGVAAPKLPDYMAELFENVFFRIAFLFLIMWTGNKDPAFALLVAVGFVISMNALSGRKLLEAFAASNDDMYVGGGLQEVGEVGDEIVQKYKIRRSIVESPLLSQKLRAENTFYSPWHENMALLQLCEVGM